MKRNCFTLLSVLTLSVISCDNDVQSENTIATTVVTQDVKSKLITENDLESFSTVKIIEPNRITTIKLQDDIERDAFNLLEDMLENNFASVYNHDAGVLVVSKESISDEEAFNLSLGGEAEKSTGKTATSVGWLVRFYEHKNQGGMNQSWSGTNNFNTGGGVSSGVFRAVSSRMNDKTSSILWRMRNKGNRRLTDVKLRLYEHNPPGKGVEHNIYVKNLKPGDLFEGVVENLKDDGFNDHASSWQFFSN